ncbi:MAG: Hdr-like menaquinol oxidoreductase cytochrome c subunit [bacterium]
MKRALDGVMLTLALTLALASVATLVLTVTVMATARAELPELPRGKGEQCVEPTDVMRRSHMDFLFHQRDAVVRDGARAARHSLVQCIECHAQRDAAGDFIPIDAPGQFCDGCHAFAAVEMDCFGCHATTPDDA